METISLPLQVEETVYERPGAWRKAGAAGKAEHIMALCARNGIKPATLLEVGAGDGAVLNVLGEHGFCPAMHAVEISRSGVAVIGDQNIHGLQECRQFNGYVLDFPDKHFDLVYLTHVLEHVEYERALLREVLRVGKHHIIEVPLDMHAIAGGGHGTSLLLSYGHINVYTPDVLQFLLRSEAFYIMDELLGKYSFEVVSHLYFEINGNQKTDAAVAALRQSHAAEVALFQSLPRREQEKKSSFYTVLTRPMTQEDAKNMHVEHIMDLLRKGQRHEALLILNAFYKDATKNAVAALLAKRCAQEKRMDDAHFFMAFAQKA